MSFKMVEKNTTTAQWYPVDTDGYITNSPSSEEPANEDCNSDNQGSVCAISMELDPFKPFPSKVTDAYADHDVLGTTQRDE